MLVFCFAAAAQATYKRHFGGGPPFLCAAGAFSRLGVYVAVTPTYVFAFARVRQPRERTGVSASTSPSYESGQGRAGRTWRSVRMFWIMGRSSTRKRCRVPQGKPRHERSMFSAPHSRRAVSHHARTHLPCVAVLPLVQRHGAAEPNRNHIPTRHAVANSGQWAHAVR